MNGWTLLLIAFVIIATVMIWNSINSKSYQRLRKARAMWKGSNPEFRAKAKARAKQDLQDLRGEIGDIWDQVTDVFDGDEDYDHDEGGYDGEQGGYM